jgi:hypothetical protein
MGDQENWIPAEPGPFAWSRSRNCGPDRAVEYPVWDYYPVYVLSHHRGLPLGAGDQNRIAAEQYKSFQSELQNDTFGQEAVQRAVDQGAMAGADTAAPAGVENYDLVRFAGSRTFVFKEGVWLDTAFDPESSTTVKIAFLSEDYFSLALSRPELAAAFALGEKVIAMSEGSAYEVVGKDMPVPGIEIAPLTTPGVGDILPILDTPAPQSNPNPLPVSSPRTSFCPAGMLPLVLISYGICYFEKSAIHQYSYPLGPGR